MSIALTCPPKNNESSNSLFFIIVERTSLVHHCDQDQIENENGKE